MNMRLNICFLLCLIHTGFINTLTYENLNKRKESDHHYWYNLGRDDIKNALNRKVYNHAAKNIIIFIGDGLGVTVNTAARIYNGQRKHGRSGEENVLTWEKFPNIALMKTYTTDRQVPDSSSTATAFFGGVKGNFYTVGVDSIVKLSDCHASLNKQNHVSSVLQWAQEAGKETGFVTNTRLTHATPASLYAHSAHRFWESDTKMINITANTEGCKDIARQLVEDSPGKDIKVILAGGRVQMGAELPEDTKLSYKRTDGRNLVNTWMEDKKSRGASYKYVTSRTDFNKIDVEGTDYIMGLFADAHLPYELKRLSNNLDVPSLSQMTEAAIKRLSNHEDGYFLMVEGGLIDLPLHDSQAHYSMEEVSMMDDAVAKALSMVDLSETLVIVTADHSHVMTMNGYPERGNDILGTSTYKYTVDGNPHSTLMFTNGQVSNQTDFYYDAEKAEVVRPDLTNIDTISDPEFIFPSYVKTDDGYETHGGEDVAAFAAGPMAHLFHRVHEQTYVAHVMGYAACLGPFKDDCAPPKYEESERDRYNANRSDGISLCTTSPIVISLFWIILLILK